MLAGLTRVRLLAILSRAERALSVHELAAELRLHPNSVREQLDLLVGAGQVERAASAPRGRGRPALRYRAIPELDPAAPYRDLAQALADELARAPDASARAIAAGERWGRAAIRTPLGETSPTTEPTDRLLALLDASGFAPEQLAASEPIRLRRCPFVPLANERRGIVCGVHLGLMRGALRELGAPLDAVRLDPFVQPDLCLAHLAPRGTGAIP